MASTINIMSIFTTWTGAILEFDKLDKYVPDIRDVAHSLSLLCRYRGQINNLYSVASHALLVEKILESNGRPPHIRFGGLHHDDPESIISDCPSPLKKLLPEFIAIEERVGKLFDWHLGTDSNLPEIKLADKQALLAETYWLFPQGGHSYGPEMIIPIKMAETFTEPIDSKIVEQRFLAKHWELKYLMEHKQLTPL